MSAPSERRQFIRINFDANAVLIDPANDRQWQTELIDISLKGALIKRPDGWKAIESQPFILRLILADQIELRFEVRVVHMKNDHVGLQIEHLDLESAAHLHRLLELNLGDPVLLQRELAELLDSD